MKSIESLDEYFTIVRQDTPSVFLFSADWCPDCRYLDRFIDDVVAKYESTFAFFKVDRDKFIDLCQTLDIMGIPSFLAYQSGEPLGRFVSKLRKTRQEVEHFLDDMLEKTTAMPGGSTQSVPDSEQPEAEQPDAKTVQRSEGTGKGGSAS